MKRIKPNMKRINKTSAKRSKTDAIFLLLTNRRKFAKTRKRSIKTKMRSIMSMVVSKTRCPPTSGPLLRTAAVRRRNA